jgi:hypothetical protein
MGMTKKTDGSSDFLTAKELAQRWKVSLRYIRDRQEKGALKPVRFGRSVRYAMRDILMIEASGGV